MNGPAHTVAVIVLAAGGARRFAGVKQLDLVDGETLVHRSARAALECAPKVVVLVAGSRSDEVIGAVSDLETVVTVVNDDWESGLASSIQAGLRELQNHEPLDGVMITLADQPLVDARCLRSLVEIFDSDHRLVAASYDGTVGAPVVVGWEYVRDLMDIRGDQGAKVLLGNRPEMVTAVPIPQASADVDTPADLDRVREAFERRSR